MTDSSELTDLIELERSGWASLCDGTGADFYGRLMTEDAVMVLANGSVLDRAAVIDSLREAPTWQSYDIAEPRVIGAGVNSCVLVYVGSANRDGGEPAFVAVMSSVYVRRGDSWRMALYQQTPVPTDGSP